MNRFADESTRVLFKLQTSIDKAVLDRIAKFLLDRESGNVKLNISNGIIRGAHIEIYVGHERAPPARRRTA